MSRTDKDRPMWVIFNDLSIPMKHQRHDHKMLGMVVLDYRGNPKKQPDECPVDKIYNWHDWHHRHFLLPCRRWPVFVNLGGGKIPHDCRLKPYRTQRRDFTKRQAKIYNSNYQLHDDLDFMDDETFELTWREKSHSR